MYIECYSSVYSCNHITVHSMYNACIQYLYNYAYNMSYLCIYTLKSIAGHNLSIPPIYIVYKCLQIILNSPMKLPNSQLLQ